MPAHGRCLRRQGEPGGAMGLPRCARGERDRFGRQAPPRPRRRHDHDRQAPRFQGRLQLWLRRAGQAAGGRRCAQRALRLLGRSLHGRQRPGHVPRGQRLLLSERADPFAAGQDRHGLEHGVQGLRRPAGHDARRADDGRHRLPARPGPARRAQAQSLRPREGRHALRHEGRRQHPAAAGARAGEDQRLPGAAQGHRGLQRGATAFSRRGCRSRRSSSGSPSR